MVTINNLTRATDRVIPGDSGPRYAYGLAYGITSGTADHRENGKTVHYSLAVEASAGWRIESRRADDLGNAGEVPRRDAANSTTGRKPWDTFALVELSRRRQLRTRSWGTE